MIDIKEISGNIRISASESDKAMYKKELMKEEYVLLTFSLDETVAFQKGDYIDLEFGRFEIVDLPIPTINDTTGGLDYEVRLDHPYAIFKNKILFYTKQRGKEKAWSLTSTIDEFVKIINDNFNILGFKYKGSVYQIVIGDGIKERDVNKFISFDSTSIWDGVDKISKEWKTEWYIDGNKVFIGKCEFGDPEVFDYSNMSDITEETNKSEKYDRIYPFGSTRNIPRYYGKELIFDITNIYEQNIFEDKSRKLIENYFLKSAIRYDDHLIRMYASNFHDNRVDIEYPTLSAPIYTDKDYVADFTNYKIYLNTALQAESKFQYEIYDFFNQDPDGDNYTVKIGEFTVGEGEKKVQVPITGIYPVLSQNSDVKLFIRITNMSNIGEWSLVEPDEGNINVRLRNPIMDCQMEFISGNNTGKIYDCQINPDAVSEKTEDFNRIKLLNFTGTLSIGDKFRIQKLKYNNIPLGYFTTPTEEEGIVKEGLIEKRLRLPRGINYVDKGEDIRNENIAEGVVVFDEIYPRIDGLMSDVHTFEIDEEIDGKKTGNKVNIWRYKDSGLNFSEDYVISTLGIHFETGSLSGLDFSVAFEPKNSDKGIFEIIRNEDYGPFLPNDLMHPKDGDTYVLYGVDTQCISDNFIKSSESKLLSEAIKYISTPVERNFTCQTNPIRCMGFINGEYNANRIQDYKVGQRANLKSIYTPQGKQSRVYGFEKMLYNKFVCTYSIGETTSYSRFDALETKVDEIIYSGNPELINGGDRSGVYLITNNDTTNPSDKNAYSALRSKIELDKVGDSLLNEINKNTSLIRNVNSNLQGVNLQGNSPGFNYPFVSWGNILPNNVNAKLDSIKRVTKDDGYYRFRVSMFAHELFQASHGSGIFQELKGTVSLKNGYLDWYEFGVSIRTYRRWFSASTSTWGNWEDTSSKSESVVYGFNVSSVFPTGGTNGTSMYTLQNAISKVPSDLRQQDLIISFSYQLNTNTVVLVSYRFNSTDLSKWTTAGYWIKLPGAIPFGGIDSLIKPELCGEYSVTDANKCIANLTVTSDFMGHVINQFIRTNLIQNESGAFDGTHNDSSINSYMRIYNIFGNVPGIDKGKFGKWIRHITELDLLNDSGNILRYFGGVLDGCTVETWAYTDDISPGDVYYTQHAMLPGFPVQYIPTFVGRIGDKYYRQFKNINSYSQSGINLDADKIYIDVNDKVMYVADPNFLYGTIQIGQKEKYLTQAQYDALGTYDDNTKYYITE